MKFKYTWEEMRCGEIIIEAEDYDAASDWTGSAEADELREKYSECDDYNSELDDFKGKRKADVVVKAIVDSDLEVI